MTKSVAPDVDARVKTLVEEVLAGSPDYLVDLEVRGASGSQAVDVFIDSDEGLSIEKLARISREIAFLLDTGAVIAGAYRLNVSSPGIDRPLKLPRQYKKNIGRTLRVHYQKPDGDGYTEVLGELVEADDEAIAMAVKKGQRRRIRYLDILWAKVQLPW